MTRHGADTVESQFVESQFSKQKKNYRGGECTCNKFVNCHDCRDALLYNPQAEREKVLDELDEIAKKGMKGKEDSLGEKYCKAHPKQVNSCWHGLHRLIQKFRQEGKQEQP